MNTQTIGRTGLVAAATVASIACLTLSLPATAVDASFKGGVVVAGFDDAATGDRNWFNPANWSTGRVPGRGDIAALDADDDVRIDPSQGSAAVWVQGLRLTGNARLELLPGSVVQSSSVVVGEGASLIQRSSTLVSDTFDVVPDSTAKKIDKSSPLLALNPSTSDSRAIKITASTGGLYVGLGGREAARGGRVGYGHHGHWQADSVELPAAEGASAALFTSVQYPYYLHVGLHYDFRPADGDVFQIMTVNETRRGELPGNAEGTLVGCTQDNVGLYMSYVAGDGNDVALLARDTDAMVCALPAVQKVRAASARIDRLPHTLGAAVEEGVAQTREHVLLARQVVLPSRDDGGTSIEERIDVIGEIGTEVVPTAIREAVTIVGEIGTEFTAGGPMPQTREHILLAH